MILRTLLAAGLLVTTAAYAGEQQFTPDTTHTILGFSAATLLFDVPGVFNRYQVKIKGDPDAPDTVAIRLEIDARSIDTANKSRDNHLRSADFFDVSTYPQIAFTSSKAWRQGGQLIVQGVLDMHGQQRPLQITFDEAKGLNGAGTPTWAYKASLSINRQEFGIGAGSVAAKISLKDDVKLNLLLVGFFAEVQPEPARKAPPKARTPFPGLPPRTRAAGAKASTPLGTM